MTSSFIELIVAVDYQQIRLDRFLRLHCPGLSQAVLQKFLRKKVIRVDGQRAQAALRLQAGQKVILPRSIYKAESSSDSVPIFQKDIAWDWLQKHLLYEDDDIWILNKPSGLASQGGRGIKYHLDGYLAALANDTGRPVLVHRLDRDTSGCIIVARNRRTSVLLGTMLQKHEIRKTYWALLDGIPADKENKISTYLRQISRQPPRMQVCGADEQGAVYAFTKYQVLQKAKGYSWLSLEPQTGRMHQLRVHAAYLNCPIVGDKRYARDSDDNKLPLDDLLHLHAYQITFLHPRQSDKMISVCAPLPQHLQRSFQSLGFVVPFL